MVKYDFKSQNGQSLIEALIALGITIIVITALAIMSTNSVRNSQFSQNQSQASSLMAQTMEQVRAARDKAGYTEFRGQIGALNVCYSINPNLTLTSLTCDPVPPTPIDCPYTASNCPDRTADNFYCRRIFVTDQPPYPTPTPSPLPEGVSVIVTVDWCDATGQHQVNASTILGKW